jgi:NADPH-dependent ferric siderophore reductase
MTVDQYFPAEVQRISRLTPNMIRVEFGGPGLSGFTTSGFADERLVVVLPTPGASAPPPPVRDAAGELDYHDPLTRPEMRSYTVRSWDPARGALVVDFVAHIGGVAAAWASTARPGHQVYLTEALGWYSPPADSAWQLLVADMTGLPALGRIVEELPPGARAHVIVEVMAAQDIQQLSSAGDVSYDWRVGRGNGIAPSALVEAVLVFEQPAGPGYVWFAAEAGESRAVRRHVRRTLGWAHERFTILGYWRHRKEEWMARYDAMGGQIEQVYEEAIAAGRSSHDALELYDEALARVGL